MLRALILSVLLCLSGLLGAQELKELQPVPPLSARVIDQTATLSADQRARLEARLDPVASWTPERTAIRSDFDLNPDFFAEVVIGLADTEDGEINDIFARVLLCREKDHKLCHILWRE